MLLTAKHRCLAVIEGKAAVTARSPHAGQPARCPRPFSPHAGEQDWSGLCFLPSGAVLHAASSPTALVLCQGGPGALGSPGLHDGLCKRMLVEEVQWDLKTLLWSRQCLQKLHRVLSVDALP